MSYHETSNFSGSVGPFNPRFELPTPAVEMRSEVQNGNTAPTRGRGRVQEQSFYHGEALARDSWGEHYGPWVVLGFAIAFTLFLLGMVVAGQTPGKSVLLKSLSDILQFVGEGIGFVFCVRIALRLQRVSGRLRHELLHNGAERRSANEMAVAHTEAQAARRAFLAWSALAVAIACYALGQAIWTSYDMRMNSADVPFPGLYDIGFVISYPFFLFGTLLLTRRNKASVGRVRLLLDALGVIGTALAISWFFLLSPLIAGLAQAPSSGAAFLSIYFPTGDLFLVAVGAFLMFSPLSNRAQQPVFMLLCMGLFFLGITDSLLAYYSLSGSFNTGTLQDVLWPLSMALIGLAAIEYPRSIAREQEQLERTRNARMAMSAGSAPGRFSQFGMTLQTITPFILVVGTCAILLTNVAQRGGTTLIQADVVALALILIVIARQALTLLENSRLTLQMRGELVISRRELQVTRREADEATHSVQEKRSMDEGIAALREAHARVARGDLAARAPTVVGPLLPIAISLNLMLDRLGSMSQRGTKYDQLAHECGMLQEAIERMGQGLPPLLQNQTIPQSAAELRSVFMGLAHLHRIQESQWRRMGGTLESMNTLTRRVHESLGEVRHSQAFNEQTQTSFERMILERIIREIDLLEQQQRTLLNQVAQANGQGERRLASASPAQVERLTPIPLQNEREERQPAAAREYYQRPMETPAHGKSLYAHADSPTPYNQRVFQSHHIYSKPITE